MKKKGFTLIELLAVIVILAIIALIATPIVMNVIENSKKGAAERSVDNYIDAVETAVGAERIDGVVLEGEYTIQTDGNLCKKGETCTDDTEIKIDMSGNKPTGGTIVISNGIVTTESTMTVGDYNVSYDSTKKAYVASKEELEEEPGESEEIEYTLEYIQGQTEEDIIKYDPVANSKCTTGDTCYSWYVLEDGDTTELVNGDGSLHYEDANPGYGTAGPREVSLIMNQNIDNTTVKWCTSGSSNTCNADGAKAYLESQTIDKGWTVEVNLPTYAQIKAVNGGVESNLPVWLYDYLNSTTHPVSGVLGYWTSTARTASSFSAWDVYWDGNPNSTFVDYGSLYGVRPVITISKSEL